MAFYTQALEGTREAFTRLIESGKPFLRPPDYYAEMVKSDKHMLKVKDALLSQHKQMEEVEERRKAREAKRFSKEVQAQKLKERAREKKQNIESVKKWRKRRQNDGFKDDDYSSFPIDLEEKDDKPHAKKRRFESHAETPLKEMRAGDRLPLSVSQTGKVKGHLKQGSGKENKEMRGKQQLSEGFVKNKKNNLDKMRRGPAPWDRSGGKKGNNIAGKSKGFQKRQARNAKYGHGGRKGLKKTNTAESSAGYFKGKQKKKKP
ncbi:hypothetical protein KP509_28G019100 [Ceratopteris richardii]|nr:hypothetical protein KP509_28G019100 [Ceratopteris richardii]